MSESLLVLEIGFFIPTAVQYLQNSISRVGNVTMRHLVFSLAYRGSKEVILSLGTVFSQSWYISFPSFCRFKEE